MMLAVSKRKLAVAKYVLERLGEEWYQIGEIIEAKTKRVVYAG